MSRVLVVGAGGYIGIPMCERLLANHHEVVAADRWFFEKKPKFEVVGIGYGRSLTADTRTMAQDLISNFSAAIGAVKYPADVVIDLSGLSNDATAEIDPELTKSLNEEGGKRVASLAKSAGVKRYIYSSSASVYGAGGKMFLSETDETNPLTAYAKSKLAVEEHLLKIADANFCPVILRNATAFGYAPRMRFDLAINMMARDAITNKRVLVRGGGNQYRPFIHVQDVVSAFCMAINAPIEKVSGQIFNVGDNALNMTIIQVANIVKSLYRDAEVINVPDGEDKRSYHLNFRKVASTLGFSCDWSIESGIKEIERALIQGLVSADDPRTITLGWYKSILEWERRLTEMRLDGRLL